MISRVFMLHVSMDGAEQGHDQ